MSNAHEIDDCELGLLTRRIVERGMHIATSNSEIGRQIRALFPKPAAIPDAKAQIALQTEPSAEDISGRMQRFQAELDAKVQQEVGALGDSPFKDQIAKQYLDNWKIEILAKHVAALELRLERAP